MGSARDKRSIVLLQNCQIKSAEKLRAVAKALDVVEKESFIKSGWIKFVDVWICPDIDLNEFVNSEDPMERVVGRVCIILDKRKFGKNSRYWPVKKSKN